MQWDNEDCLLLIQKYKKHKILWDPKHPSYFLKNKKQDAWQKIAEELCVDVEDVKRKMCNLLGSFRREKSKSRNSRENARNSRDIYVSKWFAFESLQFLLDRNDHRTNKSMSWHKDDQDVNIKIEEIMIKEEKPDSESDVECVNDIEEHEENSNVEECPLSKKKRFFYKRKRPNEDPRINEAFKILKRVAGKPRDDCVVYGEYVANELRKLDERTRTVVQHDINTILFKAKIEQFDLPGPSNQ